MSDEHDETLEYLRSVIGGRTELEWFTDSITGSDLVASPMDVFVRTTDGAVTWGWSVQPIPVDPGLRSFRRFRSADGLVILTDADEPETVFIPHTVELHSISLGRQADFSAGLPSSTVPSASVAFDLEKAARSSEGRYSIDPAFPHETISAALELWTASLLAEDVTFSWSPLSEDAESEIDALTGGGEPDEGFDGFDAEIADILSEFESVAWFQADLTWPDAGNVEAFRDRIDVRFRSPAEGLLYLATIGPLGSGDDPWITTTDAGGLMSLDRRRPRTRPPRDRPEPRSRRIRARRDRHAVGHATGDRGMGGAAYVRRPVPQCRHGHRTRLERGPRGRCTDHLGAVLG